LATLKRHLSVANVLSLMALFVALSASAYAAVTIPKNGVKTQHLANGSVTTPKLRNGAVTNPKLRNGAVTGIKIAPATIGSSQLANGAVRAGQLGGGVVTAAKLQNGAVGTDKLANNAVANEKLAGNSVSTDKLTANAVANGKIQDGAISSAKLNAGLLAQLVKDVSYVTAVSVSDKSQAKSVPAICPAGKVVVGGGARVIGAGVEHAITESAPITVDGAGKRTSWTASAVSAVAPTEDWSVEAYAICATL
jgi:hypothetical protein